MDPSRTAPPQFLTVAKGIRLASQKGVYREDLEALSPGPAIGIEPWTHTWNLGDFDLGKPVRLEDRALAW